MNFRKALEKPKKLKNLKVRFERNFLMKKRKINKQMAKKAKKKKTLFSSSLSFRCFCFLKKKQKKEE